MSNFIDSRVPDFLLAPRFKFARHFLLLLTLFCITISIFVNQSGELVLTLERFCGWLYYEYYYLFQFVCIGFSFLD